MRAAICNIFYLVNAQPTHTGTLPERSPSSRYLRSCLCDYMHGLSFLQ